MTSRPPRTFASSTERRGSLVLRAIASATLEATIRLAAALAVLGILLLFGFVLAQAMPWFYPEPVRHEVGLRQLWWPVPLDQGRGFAWAPTSSVPKYSVLPLLVGSLKISFVAVAVGAPLGLLAAIFVSQLAPRKLRQTLKPLIELAAGIPSVVLGVFALLALATWLQRTFGFEHRLNAIVAGVSLSITLVPVVFSIAEDALSAVPRSYTDTSLALGATRAFTIRHVVVPAASPGLIAAVVLASGRALGETMIALMASGNAPLIGLDLDRSTRTLTATIAQEVTEVVQGSPHALVLFHLGAMLLVLTLSTNVIAHALLESYRRRIRAGSEPS